MARPALATLIIAGCAARAGALAVAPTLPSSALSQLRGKGFAVVKDFVPPSTVAALCSDVARLRAEGRFTAAGIGDASTNRQDSEVRRCEQCFLFPKLKHSGGGDAAGRAALYSTLDALSSELERGAGEPLDGLLTEGLYAHYPSGGYYRRHVDAVASTASAIRKWSYLLYLNQAWQPADGGHLRIHTDGGGERAPAGAPASYVDVAPEAGTLVVFESSIPHEVLDTSSERLAVAGWFNKPAEGSAARRKTIAALAGAVALVGGIKLGVGALMDLFSGGGDD